MKVECKTHAEFYEAGTGCKWCEPLPGTTVSSSDHVRIAEDGTVTLIRCTPAYIAVAPGAYERWLRDVQDEICNAIERACVPLGGSK